MYVQLILYNLAKVIKYLSRKNKTSKVNPKSGKSDHKSIDWYVIALSNIDTYKKIVWLFLIILLIAHREQWRSQLKWLGHVKCFERRRRETSRGSWWDPELKRGKPWQIDHILAKNRDWWRFDHQFDEASRKR
jgi:hypothetical protein